MVATVSNTASLRASRFLLWVAPYFERMTRGKVFIQCDDGCYYRPNDGWPLRYDLEPPPPEGYRPL